MSDDPRIRSDVRNGPLSLTRSAGKPLAPPAGPLALGRPDDQFNRRPGPAVPNLWKLAHGALRGRYMIVTAVGIACAICIGILAYKFTAAPVYTSKGLMQIAYSVPSATPGADQDAGLPQFETFMQSQKTLIASRRIIEQAVTDPLWHGRPPADPDTYFAKHMTVDVKPGGYIDFTGVDGDAQTAAAAVTSIMNAYTDVYNSHDRQIDNNLLHYLQTQQTDLQSQVADITAKVREKAMPYGTTQLDDLFRDLQDKRAKQENALNDLRITMAETASQPVTNSSDAAAPVTPGKAGELSIEQIVSLDPVVRTYWEQQTRSQEEVDRLTKYGYGQSHRLMIAATRSLEEAKARTQKYADEYRKAHAAGTAVVAFDTRAPVNTSGRSFAELKQVEANLSKLLDTTNAQMVAVGNAQMDLKPLVALLAAKQAKLASITAQLDDLNGKGALGGRLSTVTRGEVPLQPSTDVRGRNATVAGLGGLFLPALAVMAVSLVRRRYRYSDEPGTDVSISRVSLLGMLPNVPSRGSTPQLRIAAAYAAHHLRVLLSSRATTVVKRTFLVTSAGEGDGKTTVTMALAISFAAAKHRTLVIDGDFVGRRLTRGFNAEQQEGLFESMGHGDIDGQWLNAASNLCILPTGKVDAADACGITAENVRLLLEQAVQHFDVVLIDTGSILGSPESAVLAREVDGVIVTISRGQPQSQVKKAILRLEALGAAVIGRVFNMADIQDFQISYVTPTSGWNEPMRPESSEVSELQQRVANFGPLVRAVAAAVPSEGPHTGPRIGSSEHSTRP